MHVPSDYHFGEHLAMNMLNSYLCCASRSCPKLEKDWKAEEVCIVTEPHSHTCVAVVVLLRAAGSHHVPTPWSFGRKTLLFLNIERIIQEEVKGNDFILISCSTSETML